MPRFFFHLRGGRDIPDNEGIELRDWQTAQHEAVARAGRLVSNDAERLGLGEDWSVNVTDEYYQPLFNFNFHIPEVPRA